MHASRNHFYPIKISIIAIFHGIFLILGSDQKTTFSKNYICAICKKGYSNRTTILRHFKEGTCMQSRIQQLTTARSFECADCGGRFSRRPRLVRHIEKNCKTPYGFSCHLCSYKGKWSCLKRHMLIIHENNNI